MIHAITRTMRRLSGLSETEIRERRMQLCASSIKWIIKRLDRPDSVCWVVLAPFLILMLVHLTVMHLELLIEE